MVSGGESSLSALGLGSGGGEMGALIARTDWAATPMGSADGWPQGLRSALGICLRSRYPIAIYWGPEVVLLYNDAWSPILGEKHPWALGRAAREVWPEIWTAIGPLFDRVFSTGEGVWQEDELLPMHRHGYTEECYFNFTFSPILDERGGVGGVFNAVIETTYRVIGERRTLLLRAIAEQAAGAQTESDACVLAARALAGASADVPFALIYLIDPMGGAAELAATAGIERGSPAGPERIALERDDALWPLGPAVRSLRPQRIDDLAQRARALPGGPWDEPPRSALVVPIAIRGQERPLGVIVMGVSPRRALDDEYQGFLEGIAHQVATAASNARAYREERARAEALAEIDRVKTAFFSNVSHELRTPLTLLLGPVESVLSDPIGNLDPAHRVELEVVHRNGLRLLKLVNTLLDFSRLEAGRIEAAYEPTDLAALTAELASTFRSAIERAGLAFTVDAPPLPEPVYVDREMWEKIVLNLLSNAFKFTPTGSIALRLRQVEEGIELSVSDTGIGIPPDELPRLFERFHRVRTARGRTQEGTGIGLALVQELVRLHGGGIDVASEPGEGTTFTVRLAMGRAHLPESRIGPPRSLESTAIGSAPFVAEAGRWLANRNGSDAGEDLKGEPGRARVLLADDNADMREYVARLLGTRWDVTAVADGMAALTSALTEPPDLVLADVMMPGLDGFALLRALRDNPRTEALPVLLLSARAGVEATGEGLAAGADDYLTKPFTGRELLARVSAHIALAGARRAALASESAARAEAERRSQQLHQALEATATVAFEWDVESGAVETSATAASVLGISPGTADSASGIVHPDDRMRLTDVMAARALGGQDAFEHEFRIIRPDNGATRWLHVSARLTRAEAGRAVRATGFARDVTERRSAEERAQAGQRLEAVGQLAGGVAHEVNNALTGVLGFANLILRRVGEGDPLHGDLTQIIRSGERAATVTQQLLAYSRRQILQPRRLDLADVVRNFEPVLKQTLGPTHRLHLDVAGAPVPVSADPGQLEQVLLNLALNARDAMTQGGVLMIAVRSVQIGPGFRQTAAGVEVPPGPYATIVARDTGIGIDRATMARLFEPFFTTKPVGQGTGLGLATVYGIVRQSGGYISVESEAGAGATFTVMLPLVPAAEPAATAPLPPAPPGRQEAVLVVDDEPAVLGFLERLLSEAGYRVFTAASAAEGLEELARLDGHLRLVITDIVMPGMNGRELGERVAKEHPGIAVLYTSGYTGDEAARRGLLGTGAAFIQKPIHPDRLLSRIRLLLDGVPTRDRVTPGASMGTTGAG